jgi:curved DNA-binding protein CbpA
MSRLEDYYALLGVSVDADVEVITKAYRRKALELHPDKQSQAAPTNSSFQLLSEAYQILKDSESRRQYDLMQKGTMRSDLYPASRFLNICQICIHVLFSCLGVKGTGPNLSRARFG